MAFTAVLLARTPALAQTEPPPAEAERPESDAAPDAAVANPQAEKQPEPPAETADAPPSAKTEPPATRKPEIAPDDGATLPAYRDRDPNAVSKPEDARGYESPPGVEPEDALLFGPRALLFVPNLALKLVFLPIRGAAVFLERHKIIDHTIDLLYNDERTAAILPTLSLQSGYGLSYGVTAFHEDLFGHDEEGAVKASYGGLYLQGYEASFQADHAGGENVWINARVRYEHKPALLFYGVGNRALSAAPAAAVEARELAVATRFRQERVLLLMGAGLSVGDSPVTKIGPTVIFNHRNFGAEARSFPEPSLETVYDTGSVVGFDDSFNLLELSFGLVHDSRPPVALPPHGTYLELFGGGVAPAGAYSFWHGGAELAQHFDLYKGNRVLVVRAALEGVAGSRDAVPFTELPRLGGPQSLRGYVRDRFRDNLAAVGTIEYRYPVHEMLAGVLFADAGKVAKDFTELLDGPFRDFRVTPGGGFILHGKEDVLISLEVAYGDGLVVFFSTDPLRAFSKREREL